MPIDRRDFLKFVVGGAVGTMVSPLPWVPMDEVAKWSQRWAPIPEKGGTSYLNSICKLCPAGCGIRVRLIEQKRAVKIDGQPNHPINRGGLCPLGLAGLQYLYLEEIRAKGPLKRAGARGKGEWRPITWDQALEELGSPLKELRQNGLSHTVALLDGQGPCSQAGLMTRFLKAYGSPNYIRPFQLGDLEEALTQTVHGFRANLAYDLPRSKYVLSFGSALMDGWGNPTWLAQAYQEWRQGSGPDRAKLVQVEAMASTTASLADEWLPAKPGTEAFLALGIAQIMLEKGWYNKEGRTAGLEGLRDMLSKGYEAGRVSALTGVPRETMEKVAREFGSAKNPVALWGRGKGELPISLFEAAAVYSLNLLAGSVGRPGGVFLESGSGYGAWTKPAMDGAAEKGLSQPRLDGAFSNNFPKTGQLANNFFAQAARKDPYPVNILMIHEANPAFSALGDVFQRALEHIPLVVSFSSFLDETSALADLILPAPTFLERWDDSYNSLGVPFPVYGLAKPVLPPISETKSTGDVFIALAKTLGGTVAESLAYENLEAVIKQSAKGVFDSKKGRLADGPVPDREKYSSASFESFEKFWEQLLVQGAWYDLENRKEDGKGKAEFPLSLLQPLQSKAARAEEHVNYPLTLIPTSLLLLQSGYLANPPFMTKYLGEETLKQNRLVAQIHPATAKNLAVHQGEIVEVKSARGKVTVQLHLFEGAMPNVIFAPLGLGHQAFDGTQKNRGANLYPLLDTAVDPATGLEVSGPTRVKIQKV